LACQDEFFVTSPLDIKENDEHVFWLCSSPVTPSSILLSLGFPYTVYAFFPERLSNHCVSVAFFRDLHKI
jgi:hypothetical protein